MNVLPPRIILVKPSHPGNIGAVARAMKTMGLKDLYLVSPKKFPHEEALAVSAHASDILENAIVVENIIDALKEITFVFATSANVRGCELNTFSPKDACDVIKTQAQHRYAILFGPENHGLSNEDLLYAHALIQIPTAPDYNSLNLAFAVQIITYEFHQMCLETSATVPEMEDFYSHWETVLKSLQFLDEANPRQLMPKLKRLFNRAHLEQAEVNILRGFLRAVDKSRKIEE